MPILLPLHCLGGGGVLVLSFPRVDYFRKSDDAQPINMIAFNILLSPGPTYNIVDNVHLNITTS